MEKINIAEKSTGDQFTAAEFNQVVERFNNVAENRMFFADYNDSGQEVAFVGGTPIKVPCDAAGVFTRTEFLPTGVSLYDSTDEEFDFSQLSIGDAVAIRLDILPELDGNNQTIWADLVLAAGTASEFKLPFITGQTYKTLGIKEALRFNEVYIGSADVRDNPSYFEFYSDGGGTLRVNGFYVRVLKR